jgi:hypothetical protein
MPSSSGRPSLPCSHPYRAKVYSEQFGGDFGDGKARFFVAILPTILFGVGLFAYMRAHCLFFQLNNGPK